MAKKILVVDDDPALVHLLKESLEGDGYVVDEAYDGLGALEQIRQSHPDALIMDVNMPGLNGTDAVSRLRQDAATAQLPIFLLTGEAARSFPEDPRTQCLQKPVDLDSLSGQLKKLLS